MCKMQMFSLGHTGKAMESTVMIEILGVFVLNDSKMIIRAVLKKCRYNKEHNFNLLSASRLLHRQGWKITCREKSLICSQNRKGRIIKFDTVVPTERCSIHLHICMGNGIGILSMGQVDWYLLLLSIAYLDTRMKTLQ